MGITIDMDPNTPRWLRRVSAYAGVPAMLAFATAVFADVTVPNAFAPDEVLSSSKMNQNFTALQDGINGVISTPRSFSVAVSAIGASSNTKGDWVVSSSRNSSEAGYSYTVNFKPGTFASPPNCTCSVVHEAGSGCTGDSICSFSGSPTTSSAEVLVTTISASPQWYSGKCSMSVICNGL